MCVYVCARARICVSPDSNLNWVVVATNKRVLVLDVRRPGAVQLQFKLAPPVGEPVSLAVMCMGSDTDDHSADTASARRTLRAWGWAVRGEPAVTPR